MGVKYYKLKTYNVHFIHSTYKVKCMNFLDPTNQRKENVDKLYLKNLQPPKKAKNERYTKLATVSFKTSAPPKIKEVYTFLILWKGSPFFPYCTY